MGIWKRGPHTKMFSNVANPLTEIDFFKDTWDMKVEFDDLQKVRVVNHVLHEFDAGLY